MKFKSFFYFFCLSSISINTFANTQNVLNREIDEIIKEIHIKYTNEKDGKVADYIPELARVDPNLFGISIVTISGDSFNIGDFNTPFAIESISKPFVYALSLKDNNSKFISEKVGLNATGHGFNSVLAIEEKTNHLQNPLVNAGALQITSYIKGKDSNEKWNRVLEFFKNLSDGKPYLGEAVYKSEMATNQHNRAIAELLNSYGMMPNDPMDAVDRYTKACSIMVTAKELALMGATLANKGVHPITKQQYISSEHVQNTLSEMVINGLYENSGSWFWKVGLPSKSGVGGGILAVVPNKMAIVVFSPRLDDAGNSIRAQKVIEDLSRKLKLHILAN